VPDFPPVLMAAAPVLVRWHLPLFLLLFLGLFDHYPLTLQTGLLLFILTLI